MLFALRQAISDDEPEPVHEAGPNPESEAREDAPQEFKVTPKVANEGHRLICDLVLPILRQVMQEADWESRPPLLQARESLRRLSPDLRFWGSNLTFSRKYTVEDIIATRYHSDVRLSLLDG